MSTNFHHWHNRFCWRNVAAPTYMHPGENIATYQTAASSLQQHIFPPESVEWTVVWADSKPSLKTPPVSSLIRMQGLGGNKSHDNIIHIQKYITLKYIKFCYYGALVVAVWLAAKRSWIWFPAKMKSRWPWSDPKDYISSWKALYV